MHVLYLFRVSSTKLIELYRATKSGLVNLIHSKFRERYLNAILFRAPA
jgi:hypothetical protein